MSGPLLASYLVLWALVLALIILVLLLYRQFGLILMPGRARTSLGGIDVGSKAPAIALRGPLGENMVVDGADSKPRAMLFASPGCPICRELGRDPELASFVRDTEEGDFIWIDREPPPVLVSDNWMVGLDSDGAAGSVMDVPGYPFLYVLDRAGHVAAKGIVNTGEEIRTLVTSVLRVPRPG
jgi:hypothetical protein